MTALALVIAELLRFYSCDALDLVPELVKYVDDEKKIKQTTTQPSADLDLVSVRKNSLKIPKI